jgi:hypothetical protein
MDQAVGFSFVPEEVLVMNAGFDRHPSETVWEEYALGMRSDEDCALLEEHLLLCSTCQDVLAKVDEYLRVVKAATALSAASGRRLSKPVVAAAIL